MKKPEVLTCAVSTSCDLKKLCVQVSCLGTGYKKAVGSNERHLTILIVSVNY